jgi:Clp amino terminal domain, pathogenicity island component
MLAVAWSARVTDSAQHILEQIPARAIDRGLGFRVADPASIMMLALWSVVLWERKVGLAALEQAAGDRFDLIRALDRLLEERKSELPEAFEVKQVIDGDNPQVRIVEPKPDQPFGGWDCEDLLEPMLRQAQAEASELGHDYIGSEHLVLSIVKLADPELSGLLRDCGVTYEGVREALLTLLRPEG